MKVYGWLTDPREERGSINRGPCEQISGSHPKLVELPFVRTAMCLRVSWVEPGDTGHSPDPRGPALPLLSEEPPHPRARPHRAPAGNQGGGRGNQGQTGASWSGKYILRCATPTCPGPTLGAQPGVRGHSASPRAAMWGGELLVLVGYRSHHGPQSLWEQQSPPHRVSHFLSQLLVTSPSWWNNGTDTVAKEWGLTLTPGPTTLLEHPAAGTSPLNCGAVPPFSSCEFGPQR